jgi:hypothetical protein
VEQKEGFRWKLAFEGLIRDLVDAELVIDPQFVVDLLVRPRDEFLKGGKPPSVAVVFEPESLELAVCLRVVEPARDVLDANRLEVLFESSLPALLPLERLPGLRDTRRCCRTARILPRADRCAPVTRHR